MAMTRKQKLEFIAESSTPRDVRLIMVICLLEMEIAKKENDKKTFDYYKDFGTLAGNYYKREFGDK